MSPKTIEINPLVLENIADALNKTNAILDLVIQELYLRHEQKKSNTTHYQCAVLIEMADAKLSDQWSHINLILGRLQP